MFFYVKVNCSKLNLFYSDKDEKQKQAEEEEMVRSLEVLSQILIEIVLKGFSLWLNILKVASVIGQVCVAPKPI